MSPAEQDQINNWFMHHPPTPEQVGKYQAVRDKAKEFAAVIINTCPPCADRTAALRQLRETAMTANAAIACN